MVKSLKKSAKRAADDRQQNPSAANIDPRTEADIGTIIPVTITSAAVNTLRGERTER